MEYEGQTGRSKDIMIQATDDDEFRSWALDNRTEISGGEGY